MNKKLLDVAFGGWFRESDLTVRDVGIAGWFVEPYLDDDHSTIDEFGKLTSSIAESNMKFSLIIEKNTIKAIVRESDGIFGTIKEIY